MTRVEIGTLSHATMRPQDLIPCFYDALNRFGYDMSTIDDVPDNALDDDDHPYWTDSDTSEYLNETLFDALNELAPPYCYFGAHEGDGSDYGFWPVVDDIQEDDDVLKVSDLSEIPNNHFGMVAVINDHGNLTLYSSKIEYVEEWSIV